MEIFDTKYTTALTEVIREIETDESNYMGAKYLPAKEVATSNVYVDIWKARGGLTREHMLDTDPIAIQKKQFETQIFKPGSYKEFIRFHESDILFLRELGQNDRSGRGIREHMNENGMLLNKRIENRMEFIRWEAIFNGTYDYQGKTIDFGRRAALEVTPVQPWGANDGNGNFTTPNPAATPLTDLRFWLQGGYAAFRKYKYKGIVMNPNTARMFIENAQVQSLISSRFSADSFKANDIQSVLNFLIPGLPPVMVYEGAYQNETVDPVSGEITVDDAEYFIPDGKIFFEPNLPEGGTLGDVAMTLNLVGQTIDNPKPGKFVLVDDKIATHPANPYVDLYGGFNGGPRLKRAFDISTATVI